MIDSRGPAAQPIWRLSAAIGVAQTYAWGVVYYPISITGKLMAADIGFSVETAFAGFSVMLVVGALAAPWVGRAIDRFGGRLVLSIGCLVAATSLTLAAVASGVVSFFFACAALGLSSALTLYDAGFAGLVQVAGRQGRRAITYVTFLGGFASTIFWPITAKACEIWGWRTTYLGFAAGMILLCLPLYFIALRPVPDGGEEAAPNAETAPAVDRPLEGATRRRAFIILAIAIAAHQAVLAALSIHIIDALQLGGLSLSGALVVGMMFGPGQVLGRVAEMVWGARFPAVVGGRISVILLPAALLFLLSGSLDLTIGILFALGLGMSNGLMTIARGTVALALFGRAGFGAVVGDLALATLFSRACGPLALAWGLAEFGLRPSIVACIFCALIAVAAMETVARIDNRHRQAESIAHPQKSGASVDSG
jgi:hypothetical protein